MREGERLKDKGVLYPTSDAFVLFVSRNRNRLRGSFDFVIPPAEVVEGMINKRSLYDAATRIGVPYPKTLFPRSVSEIEHMKDEFEFPAFLKPFYSHLWFEIFGSKGFVVNNYEELLEGYERASSHGLEAMVQTIVTGLESNIYTVSTYVATDGEPKAGFVWQKIRQCPKDFGVGSLVTSVHDEGLVKTGLRFYKEIGYRGIGSLEFKRDERDGIFKLIELNARPWLQNLHSTCAGLNLPLLEYLDLTKQELPDWGEYADGVRWHDALNDLKSYNSYRRTGTLGFGEWVRSWLGSECNAYFAWDDLLPAFKRAEYGVEVAKLLIEYVKPGMMHG